MVGGACCSRANCPNGAILRDSDTALVAFVPEMENNDSPTSVAYVSFSLFLAFCIEGNT